MFQTPDPMNTGFKRKSLEHDPPKRCSLKPLKKNRFSLVERAVAKLRFLFRSTHATEREQLAITTGQNAPNINLD